MTKRRRRTTASDSARRIARRFGARVVVKFRDDVELPWEDGIERYLLAHGLGPWSDLAARFPRITLARNVTNVAPDDFQELTRRARVLDPGYVPPNFTNYFAVDCSPDVDGEELAAALRAWPIVERAWVDRSVIGAAVPATINPERPAQTYLDAPSGSGAPYTGGINVEPLWMQCGDGSGQILVSYERAMSDHEDIVYPANPLAGVNDQTGLYGYGTDVGHGTAVLGIVAMQDNGLGGVGIAYALADFQWTSPYDGTPQPARRDALWAAITYLTNPARVAYGRVLLFEVQIPRVYDAAGRAHYNMPVEVYDDYYQTIRLATALGIIVVEPAGNGSEDLDSFVDQSTGLHILDPNVRDSGAIMVGACHPSTRTRWTDTNYGARVNCFAWGEQVWTTPSDGTPLAGYTGFGGTSAASAIIAGAALSLQSLIEKNTAGTSRYGAGQMRALLSNPATGTKAEGTAPRIGVMPDLGRIIDADALGSLPDVFLRDNLADTGAFHTGPLSMSPDIIVLPSVGAAQNPPVANGQVAYGEGSGQENNDGIGATVTAGRDNFVYVRVKNRGAVDAQNVKTTVYWAPPATLARPDTWNPIGTTAAIMVPVGGALTVTAPLRWPQAAVPASGHYCFVGLVGATGDPQPNPANIPNWLADWDVFLRLIRDNNNITWRNFDVVQPTAAATGAFDVFDLSFATPGAYDSDREFSFEVFTQLPAGANARLEVPVGLMDALGARSPFARFEDDRMAVRLAHGRRRFGPGVVPKRSLHAMRLVVEMPNDRGGYRGEAAVRQLYQDQEVGRITFRLVPPR